VRGNPEFGMTTTGWRLVPFTTVVVFRSTRARPGELKPSLATCKGSPFSAKAMEPAHRCESLASTSWVKPGSRNVKGSLLRTIRPSRASTLRRGPRARPGRVAWRRRGAAPQARRGLRIVMVASPSAGTGCGRSMTFAFVGRRWPGGRRRRTPAVWPVSVTRAHSAGQLPGGCSWRAPSEARRQRPGAREQAPEARRKSSPGTGKGAPGSNRHRSAPPPPPAGTRPGLRRSAVRTRCCSGCPGVHRRLSGGRTSRCVRRRAVPSTHASSDRRWGGRG
jgi:hypothetical protein